MMFEKREPVGEVRVVTYAEAEERLLRIAADYAEENNTPPERIEKILGHLRDGVERGVYEIGLDETDHPFIRDVILVKANPSGTPGVTTWGN